MDKPLRDTPPSNGNQFLLQDAQFPSGLLTPRMLASTPAQAIGDIYYSNGSEFVRLAIGTTNQSLTVVGGVPAWNSVQLSTTNAINSATTTVNVSSATAPSSGQVLTATSGTAATWQTPVRLLSKTITATRDLTAISGDVSYTGVGFVPTSITVFGSVGGSFTQTWGMADSSKGGNSMGNDSATTTKTGVGNFITSYTGASAFQTAIVKSFDSDGFTLTWTKSGSPTGTLTLYFLCFR